MSVSKAEYQKMSEAASPPSSVVKDCVGAFLVGGFICLIGQALCGLYEAAGLSFEDAKLTSTVSLVFLSAFFTVFGWYGTIARRAGAGTLVPITGFANSIVSPAIEFKSEGLVTGTAVKIFTIAGPVLVYGVSASVIYGVILWIISLF